MRHRGGIPWQSWEIFLLAEVLWHPIPPSKNKQKRHISNETVFHIYAKGVIKVRNKATWITPTEGFWRYCVCVWCISWHGFNPIIPKRVRHVLITSNIIMLNDHEWCISFLEAVFRENNAFINTFVMLISQNDSCDHEALCIWKGWLITNSMKIFKV